jgi:hypothetical protein
MPCSPSARRDGRVPADSFIEEITMRVRSRSATARAARQAAPLAVLALLGAAHAAPGGETEGVAVPNPKVANLPLSNQVAAMLLGIKVTNVAVAEGCTPVENPTPTVAGLSVTAYGYTNDGSLVPSAGGTTEATKTEPDKNTYLVLKNQQGTDPSYDYGTRFLFQGHESGPKDPVSGAEAGAITRINLDADVAHRVTVMATTDVNGVPLPDFDGSVWYPFSKHLLFSAELSGTTGGVWQSNLDVPAQVVDISGVTGRGGYEGLQADPFGNLWIVEDSGGAAGAVSTKAKQPNSFVYRLVPVDKTDLLAGGKLQVLQVESLATPGQPIVFHPGQAEADITSQDTLDLHTYGLTFATQWITIHDTAIDGFAGFDSNALAKAAGGTPFKRPENGQFRPGVGFTEFFFTETGDTNAQTQAGSALGGFGGLMKLVQSSPDADVGTLSLFYLGDVDHTGLDNLSFLTDTLLLVGEDCGDTLHGQRNALDSLWMFDTTADYGVAGTQPVRIVAEGRDTAATWDSTAVGVVPGFQNDGDNEITGVHVSDGNPTVAGLIGTKVPSPLKGLWRIFWTQQHGENVTWEIQRAQRLLH